jgi:hypothetical protein
MEIDAEMRRLRIADSDNARDFAAGLFAGGVIEGDQDRGVIGF